MQPIGNNVTVFWIQMILMFYISNVLLPDTWQWTAQKVLPRSLSPGYSAGLGAVFTVLKNKVIVGDKKIVCLSKQHVHCQWIGIWTEYPDY